MSLHERPNRPTATAESGSKYTQPSANTNLNPPSVIIKTEELNEIENAVVPVKREMPEERENLGVIPKQPMFPTDQGGKQKPLKHRLCLPAIVTV